MSLDAGVMRCPVCTPPGPDPSPLRLPFDWYNSAFLCSFLFLWVSVQYPITLWNLEKGEIIYQIPFLSGKESQMTPN